MTLKFTLTIIHFGQFLAKNSLSKMGNFLKFSKACVLQFSSISVKTFFRNITTILHKLSLYIFWKFFCKITLKLIQIIEIGFRDVYLTIFRILINKYL